MKQIQKMPLKVFAEECTKILQNTSSDELKTILMDMANEVKPHPSFRATLLFKPS